MNVDEILNTIQCRASVGAQITAAKPWKQGEPVEFIYAPAGVHTIEAGFRKSDSISVCVVVDEQTAMDLQESYNHLRATDAKQEPYGDEEHEGHKATLRFPESVTQLKWGTIKGESGVIVAAEPTSYGAEVVNGKVYRSWSPEFTTDADMTKATSSDRGTAKHFSFPEGVRGSQTNPARLTGVNFVMGALTNRPAFHAMPPVKAKQVDDNSDIIHGAGTSEGVKKAWETRLKGFKHSSEDEKFIGEAAKFGNSRADAISMLAGGKTVGMIGGYTNKETASQHRVAEKYHLSAALENHKEGNKESSKSHVKEADLHKKWYEQIEKGLKASDNSEFDTVAAKASEKHEWDERHTEAKKHFGKALDHQHESLMLMDEHKGETDPVERAKLKQEADMHKASAAAYHASAAAYFHGDSHYKHQEAEELHHEAAYHHERFGSKDGAKAHREHAAEHREEIMDRRHKSGAMPMDCYRSSQPVDLSKVKVVGMVGDSSMVLNRIKAVDDKKKKSIVDDKASTSDTILARLSASKTGQPAPETTVK